MFISLNQLYVFICAFSIGSVFGIAYSCICLLKRIIKLNFLRIIADVVFYGAFGIFFVFCSYYFRFPNFRFYMLVGALSGLFVYVKSFHFILAKKSVMIYNNISERKRSTAKWKKAKHRKKIRCHRKSLKE